MYVLHGLSCWNITQNIYYLGAPSGFAAGGNVASSGSFGSGGVVSGSSSVTTGSTGFRAPQTQVKQIMQIFYI